MAKITSEADAWSLLLKIEQGHIPETIEFSGWPVVPVKLKGNIFHSSLTTNVMAGHVEIEACLRRAYALLRYGQANKRLSKQEKESLRVIVNVRDGSTESEIDLQQLAANFIGRIADKMDKQTIITLGLAAILSYASLEAFRSWIDRQNHESDIEKELNIARINKEHEDALTRLAEKSLQFALIHRDADSSKPRLLKSWSEADEVSIGDIELSKSEISQLTANQRERAIEFDVRGLFFIDIVNAKPVDEIRLSVRDAADNGMRISVLIKPNELSHDEMTLLKDSSFSKKPLQLTLHAKQIKGDIKSASLVKVEAPLP